ncbi:hypothetical protein ACFRAR_38040, partial [Kitasatospora sp. NPDC056651]|uniref:hypothetical protein n=1 Tax=Kitasatospora sp. NPDC056651 TaxID=3345892 RepID=UPI0036B04FD5
RTANGPGPRFGTAQATGSQFLCAASRPVQLSTLKEPGFDLNVTQLPADTLKSGPAQSTVE